MPKNRISIMQNITRQGMRYFTPRCSVQYDSTDSKIRALVILRHFCAEESHFHNAEHNPTGYVILRSLRLLSMTVFQPKHNPVILRHFCAEESPPAQISFSAQTKKDTVYPCLSLHNILYITVFQTVLVLQTQPDRRLWQ